MTPALEIPILHSLSLLCTPVWKNGKRGEPAGEPDTQLCIIVSILGCRRKYSAQNNVRGAANIIAPGRAFATLEFQQQTFTPVLFSMDLEQGWEIPACQHRCSRLSKQRKVQTRISCWYPKHVSNENGGYQVTEQERKFNTCGSAQGMSGETLLTRVASLKKLLYSYHNAAVDYIQEGARKHFVFTSGAVVC